MVTDNHYRWDFIMLSTDVKPTPATSKKVTNGSTLYTSDDSKLYVWYKDQWYEKTATGGGGGTTYTAGDGITIADDTISVDTTTIQEKLTAGTGIEITDNTISATGGGGDTVYSTVTTSNLNVGGAVYIGNLNANQEEQPDPTPSDIHEKYFWALPTTNSTVPGGNSVNILGSSSSNFSTVIGKDANAPSIGSYGTAIGAGATVRATYGVAIGSDSYINNNLAHSVALGDRSLPTRAGEVHVGQNQGLGFNNTKYRVIGGVHDGQGLHDVATVAQGNTLSTSAPTTSTEGVLGQLWTDTTNMHTYQCTAISGDTYTWTQRW